MSSFRALIGADSNETSMIFLFPWSKQPMAEINMRIGDDWKIDFLGPSGLVYVLLTRVMYMYYVGMGRTAHSFLFLFKSVV